MAVRPDFELPPMMIVRPELKKEELEALVEFIRPQHLTYDEQGLLVSKAFDKLVSYLWEIKEGLRENEEDE